ncbi:hypothetical protein B0H16DRAFT_1698199, partial [Mycena metata]
MRSHFSGACRVAGQRLSPVNQTLYQATKKTTFVLGGLYKVWVLMGSRPSVKLSLKMRDARHAEAVPLALSIAVNPGGVATETVPLVRALTSNSFTLTPLEGAGAALYTAGTSPGIRAQDVRFKGAYLDPTGEISQPIKDAQHRDLMVKLWEANDKIIIACLTCLEVAGSETVEFNSPPNSFHFRIFQRAPDKHMTQRFVSMGIALFWRKNGPLTRRTKLGNCLFRPLVLA